MMTAMGIILFHTPNAGNVGVGDMVWGTYHQSVQHGCITGFDFDDDAQAVQIKLTVASGAEFHFDVDNVYATEQTAWQRCIFNLDRTRDSQRKELAQTSKNIRALCAEWGTPPGVKP